MLSAGTGSSNYTVSGVPDRRAGDGGTREAGHVLHYGVSNVECRHNELVHLPFYFSSTLTT